MRFLQHRGHQFAAIATIAVVSMVAGSITAPASLRARSLGSERLGSRRRTRDDEGGDDHGKNRGADPVLLFAADGMRQDLVERYTQERNGVPGFAELLKKGAAARDGGMLTQATPNTGAGWYTMATGAWPGVHGSTNNTSTSRTTRSTAAPRHSTQACCRPRRSPSPPNEAARR